MTTTMTTIDNHFFFAIFFPFSVPPFFFFFSFFSLSFFFFLFSFFPPTVACRYHLDYLEKLLVPTQVTKMGLWTLDQEDDFYQDGSATSMSGAAENSIWHILCRECDVTEEQKSRIVSHRGRIRSLCGDLKASLELLSSLRNKVDGKNEGEFVVCSCCLNVWCCCFFVFVFIVVVVNIC